MWRVIIRLWPYWGFIPSFAAAISVALMGGAFAGFQGNAAPPPRCVIADPDPPTNVRTRANGVIIGTLSNGDRVRVIDQIRAMMACGIS
jgi:hypothetical protein